MALWSLMVLTISRGYTGWPLSIKHNAVSIVIRTPVRPMPALKQKTAKKLKEAIRGVCQQLQIPHREALVPAVYHHRLVLSGPFGPYQSHKVQEVSGVIRDAVVRPGQVLNLSELSLLLALNTHKRWGESVDSYLYITHIIIMITFTLQKMVKVFTILRLIPCPFLSIWDTSTTRNRSGTESKKREQLFIFL